LKVATSGQSKRALSLRTVFYYVDFARSFLEQKFGEGKLELSALHAVDVIRFIQRQAARGSRGAARKLTTAWRSFLRYARYRDYITIDLATGVPAVANWSMPSIPRSIKPEHVRRVLAHCDRRRLRARVVLVIWSVAAEIDEARLVGMERELAPSIFAFRYTHWVQSNIGHTL
jgi:site-specific recombinase XerC